MVTILLLSLFLYAIFQCSLCLLNYNSNNMLCVVDCLNEKKNGGGSHIK